MTADSKTEPLLFSGAYESCGEAISDLLAHAVDAADHRPLDSMVAAIGVGRDNRLSAALSTRAYASTLPLTNEAFTRALAMPRQRGGLLLFIQHSHRSVAKFVDRADCLEATFSLPSMVRCPACA